jgi:hypothetical protein
MKLVKPAQTHVAYVVIKEKPARQIARLLMAPRIPERNPNMIRLTSCVIDFGTTPVILGKKIEKLQFGTTTYYGVMPVMVVPGHNTIECVVDKTETEQ